MGKYLLKILGGIYFFNFFFLCQSRQALRTQCLKVETHSIGAQCFRNTEMRCVYQKGIGSELQIRFQIYV